MLASPHREAAMAAEARAVAQAQATEAKAIEQLHAARTDTQVLMG